MIYLGVDYGRTKVGLAISEGQVASIYEVLKINSLKDGLEKVKRVIEKEKVERVVVGLPESGEARAITKKFLKELKKESLVEIIETEETLSSFQARNMMHTLHLPQKSIDKKEDQYAAAIILQTFLDSLQ